MAGSPIYGFAGGAAVAETVISSSGTRHVAGTAPGEDGIRAYPGRVRTICGMHIRTDQTYAPSGKVCEWCKRAANEKEEV